MPTVRPRRRASAQADADVDGGGRLLGGGHEEGVDLDLGDRGDEPAAVSVKRVAWNSANTIPGADRPTGLFESYSGWSYRVADGGTAWIYLHVFA